MPEPTKIPRPFADSGDKNSIPDSSGGLGFASWQEGFPAITGTPFAQGGVAPKRADFNGIFNALSLATVWQQQGGFYAYDNNTDYEVGNVVEYNNDLYKCLTANGPSSAVKAPTDATVWSKVMTASDAAALYLPLSGGEMTGNIVVNSSFPALMTKVSDSYLWLGNVDYNGGSSLYLNGKDRTSDTGQFALTAYDGANRKILNGRPDGTLTWDGKDIVLATLDDATAVNFNSLNIANNTLVNCTSAVFSPGVYLLIGTCAFGTNPTGYRQLGFSLSSTYAYTDRYSYSRCAACSDSDTTLQVLLIRKFTTSTTLYLNARQTSGSSLECSGGILYRKIA